MPSVCTQRRPRVLIVDDDPVSRAFVSRRLKAMAEVTEASDGEEARSDLSARNYDLVVLDLDMPRLNGLQLIQFMRARQGLRHIPIIVLTANECPTAFAHAYMAGVTSVLCKPLNWRAFGEHVRHLLELAFRSSHLALHDQLTGLPNRIFLNERIRHALDHPAQPHLALMAIDLDRFKPVNDKYGHAEGDKLLVEVARRLTAALPQGVTPARTGGDEFIAVGRMTDPEAHEVANALIATLHMPYPLAGGEARIGASIGIAFADEPDMTPEQLAARADRALYRVKAAGKGAYAVYDAHLDGAPHAPADFFAAASGRRAVPLRARLRWRRRCA